MIHTTHKETTALWIDDNQITASEAISLIRKQGNIPRLVQEWVLDNTVGHIDIDKNLLAELLGNYRTKNQLHTDAAYTEHLQKRHIDESLLLRMLARPYQVIKYREDRWGPVAESLYIKKKEQFDLVTYQRLESNDLDVMQEVYFRLKEGEEDWEGLARQFPGAADDARALQGPISATDIEKPVLEALRESKPGSISRPIQIGSKAIVVGLENFEPSSFGDKVRESILRQAFDEWLGQECSKMIKKVRFPQ